MKDAYPRNANLACNEYWKAEMQYVDSNTKRPVTEHKPNKENATTQKPK